MTKRIRFHDVNGNYTHDFLLSEDDCFNVHLSIIKYNDFLYVIEKAVLDLDAYEYIIDAKRQMSL